MAYTPAEEFVMFPQSPGEWRELLSLVEKTHPHSKTMSELVGLFNNIIQAQESNTSPEERLPLWKHVASALSDGTLSRRKAKVFVDLLMVKDYPTHLFPTQEQILGDLSFIMTKLLVGNPKLLADTMYQSLKTDAEWRVARAEKVENGETLTPKEQRSWKRDPSLTPTLWDLMQRVLQNNPDLLDAAQRFVDEYPLPGPKPVYLFVRGATRADNDRLVREG